MEHKQSNLFAKSEGRAEPAGSQTLLRGLDLIDAVRAEPLSLSDLASALGLTRSTTHRLASALAARDYLVLSKNGYQLGPKLLELGYKTERQTVLAERARPELEHLARATGDTALLAVPHDGAAICLAMVKGQRRIGVTAPIGERHSLIHTAMGQALLLDESEEALCQIYHSEIDALGDSDLTRWADDMRRARQSGVTYTECEGSPDVRGAAAPVRGPRGGIVASVGIYAPEQFLDRQHVEKLRNEMLERAGAISRRMGAHS